MESAKFNLKILNSNEEKTFEKMGFMIKIYHDINDAENVKRISIKHKDMNITLLPSKGLSILEAYNKETPFFWEPPMIGLPDPDDFNPLEKIYLSGVLTEGYGWLLQFTGGVEMLGLENWGMPKTDFETGIVMPMHGTASLIPIGSVEVKISKDRAEIIGEFEVRKFRKIEKKPWYENGDILYKITKRVIIIPEIGSLILKDTITNKSKETLSPEWGYHVQMKAEPGAEYLIPSKKMKRIGDISLTEDAEIWYNSKCKNVREQTMNRHEKLRITDNVLKGERSIETLLKYADGHAIKAIIPACSWFASWFSAGGENGQEWCIQDKLGNCGPSIMKKSYDGIGPEFGNCDLFGEEDEEKEFKELPLKPEESVDIITAFEMLFDTEKIITIRDEIKSYNIDRKIN